MNWLHYLVEANIYLGVFYLCYCLFLNNETHYVLGRAYLLFSCFVAFVLPVTQLSILKPVEPQIQQVAYTAPGYNNAPVPEIIIEEPVPQFTLQDALLYIYIIGAVISLIVLYYRLYRLFLLTRIAGTLTNSNYKVIQLNGDNTAFSFFNYLFIGTGVPQPETIIAHELVHIRQKHSADIMFIELIKVVNWFNPFIYLLQRSLRTIHEYIADEQTAAKERDALTYSSFLLNNAYGIQGSPVAHSFFNYNLLKKRIIMLNQKRSGRLARLKYLAAVPLCAGMLCASTLVFSKDYAFIDLAPRKAEIKGVTIDEPKTIKYFKIVDKEKDLTAYSDNLSFKDKGITKRFSAKSTTPADMVYIQKTMKLNVQVIDVDSKTMKPVPPIGDNVVGKIQQNQLLSRITALRRPFDAFITYLNTETTYPKDALSDKIKTSIVVDFKVDEAGKVRNVTAVGDVNDIFLEAVKTPMEKYDHKINAKAGVYRIGINFYILGQNNVFFPVPKSIKTANYIGETYIVGMTAAQRKIHNQSPPPPPVAPKVSLVPPKVKVVKFPPPAAAAKPKPVPEIEIVDVPAVKDVPEIEIMPITSKKAKRTRLKITPKPAMPEIDNKNFEIVIDSPVVVTPAKKAKVSRSMLKPAKTAAIIATDLKGPGVDNAEPISFTTTKP